VPFGDDLAAVDQLAKQLLDGIGVAVLDGPAGLGADPALLEQHAADRPLEADRRPAGPHSELVHTLFRYVRAAGFDGVSEPVGIDPDDRERLVSFPGEVALPPLPAWSQTDRALESVAELFARFHDAARGFEAPAGTAWNRELADPAGNGVAWHNDACWGTSCSGTVLRLPSWISTSRMPVWSSTTWRPSSKSRWSMAASSSAAVDQYLASEPSSSCNARREAGTSRSGVAIPTRRSGTRRVTMSVATGAHANP
jgi:hypothetical protein